MKPPSPTRKDLAEESPTVAVAARPTTDPDAAPADLAEAPEAPAEGPPGGAPAAAGGKRSPGRPRADDANQRERLLDAAIDCYRRDGIAATTARSIADAAGVTPALVNYYFGGKDKLLDAVVAERIMPAITALRANLEAAGGEPRALAEAFVRGLHAAVAERPWFPSLWVREVLSENGALREMLLKHVAPAAAQPLAARFAGAQAHGALPAGVDPRLLVVSLIGLTMFPLAAAPIWRRVFDASDLDSAALERHTLALLAHAFGESHDER
jgi:AcrR family transcriptional regulator